MNDKVEHNEMLIQNDADIDIASRALKAMAHPLRLKILCILGTNEEISVQDLVERSARGLLAHLREEHDL